MRAGAPWRASAARARTALREHHAVGLGRLGDVGAVLDQQQRAPAQRLAQLARRGIQLRAACRRQRRSV